MIFALVVPFSCLAAADVRVSVNADSGRMAISPLIYGINNGISDDPSAPTSDSVINLYRGIGVKMIRMSGGNNQTKYNWRAKLSSHPDWFNNVYAHDWDSAATTVQNRLPGVQGLFGFQLLDKAASNTGNNWDDYTWGSTHNWTYPSVLFNLAGGGSVSADGSTQLTAGDPSKYLESWPADSSVGIINHWFGAGGAGLDSTRFRIWDMDNEPDDWSSTHDDIVDSSSMQIDTFIAHYIKLAVKARRLFPGIILAGPVYGNDWGWWTWNNVAITRNGTTFGSLEYFIKQVGQAEKDSGLKLLDVVDLHFYPGDDDASKVQQVLDVHRVFFDTTYNWPGSNGIHAVDNKWGTSVPNYIFLRAQRWMNQYLGAGRANVAMSEFGAATGSGDANVSAVSFASILGTFADHGVKYFTPWDWYPGWFEAMHLFTTCAKSTSIASISSIDTLVSAYSSLSSGGDSMTVVLVNRDQAASHSVDVSIAGFVADSAATTASIFGLNGETFVSASSNAMTTGTASVSSNKLTVSLPALSVKAVCLTGSATPVLPKTEIAAAGLRVSTHDGIVSLASGSFIGKVSLYGCDGRCLRRWNISGKSSVLDLRKLHSGYSILSAGNRTVKIMLP